MIEPVLEPRSWLALCVCVHMCVRARAHTHTHTQKTKYVPGTVLEAGETDRQSLV